MSQQKNAGPRIQSSVYPDDWNPKSTESINKWFNHISKNSYENLFIKTPFRQRTNPQGR